MKNGASSGVNLVQLSRIQSHDRRGCGDGGSFAVGGVDDQREENGRTSPQRGNNPERAQTLG